MCFSWFFKSQKKTTKQRNVTTCTNSTHQPAPMTRPDRPTSSVPRYCQGGDNKMHRNKLPKEGQHPLGKSAMPQPCHENMSRFLMVENHVFFLNNCDVLLMLCFFLCINDVWNCLKINREIPDSATFSTESMGFSLTFLREKWEDF